jgi:hypothetical protein
VITSRREPDIEDALSRRPNVVVRELDIANDTNGSDIESYLRHHMDPFVKKQRFQLASDWPGEEKIRALVLSSAGLFIWASTAVKFIEEGNHPDRQLDVLLCPHPREAESTLDALYATALGADGKWSRDKDSADFLAILGAIVTAREPLSDTMIDHILDLDGSRSSRFVLERLRCLLQWSPGQPVRTLHASFADYLTDVHRCRNRPWFVDISSHHRYLALASFRIMEAKLKFNICGLETSHVSNDEVPDLPARIQNYIPNYLYYACRFWADHLRGTDFESDFLPYLNDFFRRQLLYWLEVLSLTKAVHIASPALLSIVDWVQVSASIADLRVQRWELISMV